jgi:hypothetical protein
MKNSFRLYLRFFIAMSIMAVSCSAPPDEFVNPPSSVRPGAYWCWLNGNMSTTSITRDLEAMKAKGINRAEIWDIAAVRNPSFIAAGGAFLGDESVSDQLIFSHYQTGTEFLKKYNAYLVSESGGPGPPIWETCPVDALKALGAVSVPRGEFWIQHRNMFLIKEVSSAAHIYGHKLVDAESFTTWRRWKDSPFDLKKLVDRAFCEGLNNITFTTFASTNPEDGLPGRTLHAGYLS